MVMMLVALAEVAVVVEAVGGKEEMVVVAVADLIFNEVSVMELILAVVNRCRVGITINDNSSIINLTPGIVVPTKDHSMDHPLRSIHPIDLLLPPPNPPISQDSMEDEIQLMTDPPLLLNAPFMKSLTPISSNLRIRQDSLEDEIQLMMDRPPPSTHSMNRPLLPSSNLWISRGSTGDEIQLHRNKGCIQDPFHSRESIIEYTKACMMVVGNINLISSSRRSIHIVLRIIIVLNRFR